jgi:DNA-binding beta-propeller fold protein YncE
MKRHLAVLRILAVLTVSALRADASCLRPEGGWGVPGSGPGQFQLPEALVQDPSGRWLVADEINGRVNVYDHEGNFLAQIASRGTAPGQLYYPCGIALGPDHLVYVSENQTHRVSVFDLEGNFVRTIGMRGYGPGQLYYPVGVSISAAGHLYVADYGNSRIDEFLLDGSFVASLARGVTLGPYGVRVGPDGNLWVSEYDGDRVLKITPAGELLGAWSGSGDRNGEFSSPENVTFDAAGNIYVFDTGNRRVQVFDPNMNFMCRFGTEGSGAHQFYVPTDGAFDAAGQLFITDYGNNRIRIWRQTGPADLRPAAQRLPARRFPAGDLAAGRSTDEELTFSLGAVGPSPGGGPVRIPFSLARSARIQIDVFDLLGRNVATPAQGMWPAGTQVVEWDGMASVGGPAPAGVYLVRYAFPGGQDQRRVMRVR